MHGQQWLPSRSSKHSNPQNNVTCEVKNYVTLFEANVGQIKVRAGPSFEQSVSRQFVYYVCGFASARTRLSSM